MPFVAFVTAQTTKPRTRERERAARERGKNFIGCWWGEFQQRRHVQVLPNSPISFIFLTPSSDPKGHDQSCQKGVESNMKPFFLLSSADVAFATSHADSGHSIASAPYPCADPYLCGMLAPYGPQSIIQPQLATQMARMTATRVPLPFGMADEGPIYVNAKQYHGILRRRQSRAKLEAQNKLVKNRKPYLHESRHRHAINRVRGTGGRFLSSKKVQQSNPGPTTNKDSVSETIHVHQKNAKFHRESSFLGAGQSGAPNTSCSDLIGVSNNDVIIRPPDSLFSGISVPIGGRM